MDAYYVHMYLLSDALNIPEYPRISFDFFKKGKLMYAMYSVRPCTNGMQYPASYTIPLRIS